MAGNFLDPGADALQFVAVHGRSAAMGRVRAFELSRERRAALFSVQ